MYYQMIKLYSAIYLVRKKPKLADVYFNKSSAVERNAPAAATISGTVGVVISLPPGGLWRIYF